MKTTTRLSREGESVSRPGDCINVVLLYSDASEAYALRRRLEACAAARVTLFTDRVTGTGWDVIVVDATSSDLSLVEYALREWESLGAPELVVAPSQPCASVVSALACLGIRHIMTLEAACVWMPQTVHALANLARARRAEKRALEALAEVPRPLPCMSAATHPLFTAESSFRETYLRLLVARNPTIREAAAAAGVPYRSFQRMLTTYGIRRADGAGTSNQGSAPCKSPVIAIAPPVDLGG